MRNPKPAMPLFVPALLLLTVAACSVEPPRATAPPPTVSFVPAATASLIASASAIASGTPASDAVGSSPTANVVASPVTSSAPAESSEPSMDPSTGVPAPTTASDPSTVPAPSSEPTGGASAPAASIAPATKSSKEVLGFFLPSQLDDVKAHADLSVLTSLAYFGISSNKNGGLHRTANGAPDFRWTAWHGTRMTKLIEDAHAAGTKMIMTLTRFSWNHTEAVGTVKLLSSKHARQRLAGQAAAEVVARGVDGINVDFEPIPDGQSANFVDFVRRLRHEMDARQPGLELTVDTTGYIANYDIAGLTKPGAADAIYIMAYHYTGAWSNRAGAVSPLHRSTYDVTDTVDAFLQFTTPDKLMLGLAWYGNLWSTVSSGMNSRTRPPSSSYGSPGSLPYADAAAVAASHGRLWDSVEQVPWTRWQARMCSSCPVTWRQLYYEDAQSLKAKHQLVLDRGLRGTGIWTLGFGGSGSELYDEMRNTFGSH